MAENENTGDGRFTFNYGRVLDMASCDCCEIRNKTITDVYAAHEGAEEKTADDLDRMMTYMYEKRHGFAGFLSFSYAQLTMLHLLGRSKDAARVVDQILRGLDAVERYCFTGNYLDSDGKPSGFTNFSCGESAEELETAVRFSKDTYDTARLVHSKAGSFESAYSLGVASIMYHLSVNDISAAENDCSNMRKLCSELREFLVNEVTDDKHSDAEKFSDFGNVEDLKNG